MASQRQHFFTLDNMEQGLFRQLTDEISTRIFPGDQAMLSVVRVAPMQRAHCTSILKSNGE
jgi:hypothetical protein